MDGFSSSLVGASFKASIFAAIGVLSGSKFNGGSFKACRPFRPRADCCFPLASGVFVPTTRGPLYTELSWLLLVTADGPLESEPRLESEAVSSGRLDFRELGGKRASDSVFGDSYALGIAGTGGTSSSEAPFDASVRGFGVGSRDEENV